MPQPVPPTQSVENGMFVCDYGGTDSRLPLLYLHGLGVAGLCFEEIVRHPLIAARRQLVVDLPGYGRSLWAEEPTHLEELAAHLAGWLTERGEGPVIPIGHSMGGVLAVYLAEQHPERVKAIINVEGNISPGDCSSSAQAANQSLDEFIDGGFVGMIDAAYRHGSKNPGSRMHATCMPFCDPHSFHRHSQDLVRVSDEQSMAKRMAALSCPVHFIAGQPGGSAARSIELLEEAGVPLTKISPAGHWPFIDQPDAFASAVAEFMNQIA